MPNVKQADLDAMHNQVSMLDRMVIEERGKRHTAEARTDAFDSILAKVVATAGGSNLQSGYEARAMGGFAEDRAGGMVGVGAPWRYDPHSGDPVVRHQPDPLERGEAVIADLYARLLVAEGRLSAVVAIGQFAREHKA